MSLFVCDECGTIENTALSRYWMRHVELGGRRLCSACDPALGSWHGRFPRQQFDPARHELRDGHVYTREVPDA